MACEVVVHLGTCCLADVAVGHKVGETVVRDFAIHAIGQFALLQQSVGSNVASLALVGFLLGFLGFIAAIVLNKFVEVAVTATFKLGFLICSQCKVGACAVKCFAQTSLKSHAVVGALCHVARFVDGTEFANHARRTLNHVHTSETCNHCHVISPNVHQRVTTAIAKFLNLGCTFLFVCNIVWAGLIRQ